MTNLITHIVRIILGLALVFFAIAGFFNIMEAPEFNEAASAFGSAIVATGYLFPLMDLINIFAGILLLANRCTPLASLLILPFTLNVFLFHLFLDMNGIGIAIVLLGLNTYMLIANTKAYRSLCKC